MTGSSAAKRQGDSLAEVHDLDCFRQAKVDLRLEAARDLLACGREDDALSEVFSSLALSPQCYEALSLAGTLLAMLGDARASVLYTREAIRLRPERADAYYDLGATLLELDRPEEALEWLEGGLLHTQEEDEDLREFLYSARIEALVQLRRIPAAQEALREARARTRDALGLLDGAQRSIEGRPKTPSLRVV